MLYAINYPLWLLPMPSQPLQPRTLYGVAAGPSKCKFSVHAQLATSCGHPSSRLPLGCRFDSAQQVLYRPFCLPTASPTYLIQDSGRYIHPGRQSVDLCHSCLLTMLPSADLIRPGEPYI